ncbi:MAG: ATP-dependent protease [Acidobacteria bacterium]|nr:MAG: ATP-dependent protease [Acidobacteriota bacterium]
MRQIGIDELSWTCPEPWVPWDSSSEVAPAPTIIGQDRAVQAIAFGLGMRGVGYNVFVTGLSGTGRLTTIKQFLEGRSTDQPRPDDVCYVYNFIRPEEPCAVFLEPGAGRRFRDCMNDLVRDLSETLPAMAKDQAFRKKIDKAVEDLRDQEKETIGTFETEVAEAGFALVQIQVGAIGRPEVLPIIDDEPTAMEDLAKTVESGETESAEFEALQERYSSLKIRLQEVFALVGELRQQIQKRVEEVQREMLSPAVEDAVDRVRESVNDPRVNSYLEAMQSDLIENMELFGQQGGDEIDIFLRWRVNLVVDNGHGTDLPVILETEPTYTNIFGTVERSLTPSGEMTTSFMRIRAGSLLTANGGFLVLNAEDLLMEPRVWPGLKRALKYGRVKIQSMEGLLLGGAGIKPQEVPLQVKVVVIGDRTVYDMLYRYDRDFAKVFKVLADFDLVIPAVEEHAKSLVSVFSKVIADEELTPMDRTGMVTLLEEAVRMARGRKKFSSRFSDLSDLLREASWLAEQAGADAVGREHVKAARESARRRHSLSEDRTHELVEDGIIKIQTEGLAVGRLNGLAVYDVGHHRFGRPSRISARIGIGREGVINVERQARLSGPTHDKGIQILTGFLRGTFARTGPLSMACSVTFEQSYGGVDGDSASSTEIYAILSALADVPLRQDVAVTGSVDQYGAIQSIGGVNEKIKGFFRVCDSRGLTGTQGVMIPASDVNDLHLADEVIEAVRDGRFAVWAVETIEEGIEHLTGVAAGTQDENGDWSEGSVFDRCRQRLEEMARLFRNSGKQEDNGDEPDDADEDKDPPSLGNGRDVHGL